MTDIPVTPPPLAKKSLWDRITYHLLLWSNIIVGSLWGFDFIGLMTDIGTIQDMVTNPKFKAVLHGLSVSVASISAVIHFLRNFRTTR